MIIGKAVAQVEGSIQAGFVDIHNGLFIAYPSQLPIDLLDIVRLD